MAVKGRIEPRLLLFSSPRGLINSLGTYLKVACLWQCPPTLPSVLTFLSLCRLQLTLFMQGLVEQWTRYLHSWQKTFCFGTAILRLRTVTWWWALNWLLCLNHRVQPHRIHILPSSLWQPALTVALKHTVPGYLIPMKNSISWRSDLR